MSLDKPNLADPKYTPVRLINETAALLRAKNDHQLAYILEMDPAQLSRIRHRKESVSATMMVSIMDRTGWTIVRVRELAGMEFDGVAKLVVIAQTIGMRFPRTFTLGAEDRCRKTDSEATPP